MKEGWKYEILGNVCDVLDSKRKPITKIKRVPGTVPYYGATGVLDFVKDFIFDEKLVLLGEDGAKWGAGEVSSYIINGKSWVNNHAHTLRPKRYIITDEFLVYYLNYSNLLDYVSGTTVPKLNQANMRRIEIPLPTLSDQQKIVDLLDAEFEKIDAIKANAASQLQAAKDLFQSALKELLTPKEGWEMKKIHEIADVKGGKRVPRGYKFESNKTKHIYIRVSDFDDNGTISCNDLQYISDDVYEKIKRYTITSDDMYISIAGTIGKAGIIPERLNGANLTENACKLVLKGNIYKFYLYYITLSPNFKEEIKRATKIGSQPKLALTRLEQIPISFPPLPEQERIVASLDAISEKVKALQSNYDQTITLCNDLKQALLKSIFE